MNPVRPFNLVVAIANFALAFYLLWIGEFLVAVMCGVAGAYNLALWREIK